MRAGLRPPKWVELARGAALCALIFVVWALHFDKTSWAAFQRPISYTNDSLYLMGQVKAAEDLDALPVGSREISRLGAPFVANWNDFPQSDDWLYFLCGLLARACGPIAAVNLVFVLLAMAAGASMYGVARWLRLRWQAGFVAGALFALSPFFFYRGLKHFTLTGFWLVPLMIPLALWVARARPLTFRSTRFGLAALVAVLAGVSNPYFLNYGLELVGLGVVTQLFRGRWRRTGTAFALVGLALGAFLVVNFETLAQAARLGVNRAPVMRLARDVETFALRPLELFLPGQQHRLAAFAGAAERHAAAAFAVGEFPSPYLGVLGGVAFLWLLAVLLRSVLLGKRAGWGRLGVWAVWLVFVGVAGGLMQTFQEVTNLRMFRSNNRVSIFLLAFALLFGARLLSAVRPRAVFLATCFACLVFGLLDQVPGTRVDANAPHWETVAERERLAAADEKLVAEAERRLPAGAQVFQLPAMAYPEAGYIGRTPDYDQFRPYLFSRHLRFSYGNMKGRPEYEWQQQVGAMNDDDRLAALKDKGFLALYVLKNGFPPEEVERLLGSLRARGHTEVLESEAGDSCFVLLKW